MPAKLPRLALTALALVAALLAAAALYKALKPGPRLDFVERAAPEGFRDLIMVRSEGGASTAAALAPPAPAPTAPSMADAEICTALFDDPDDLRFGAGDAVAVYFTDYRCPYCRIMGELLFERAAADDITLIVKEWPILGPASVAGARMALAAARQGAYEPAHVRLAHTPFTPTPSYGRQMAQDLGIDPARMAADMAGPEVEAQLARTAALARALGIGGTPGLVVGRTVTKRSVREPMLDALIRAERALGPAPC